MKAIVLTAFNRLGYLEQMIESLSRNNLKGYTLFVGVEPDTPEVVNFCQGLDFMPAHVTVNPAHLGVRENPYATISRAFQAGSTFNVVLEDDLVLSPDALDLAEWFRTLPANEFFCLNLFTYGSNAAEPCAVREADHFAPLGWALSARVWEIWVKPNWRLDERGWDFSMNAVLSRYGPRKLLHPALARANHIGREGGVHCRRDFHDRTFSHLPISDGTSRDYRIVG